MHPPDTARDEQELIDEAEAVRRARGVSMRALSPADRIERLHALCVQIAAVSSRPSGGPS